MVSHIKKQETHLRHARDDDAEDERDGPGGEMEVGSLSSQIFSQFSQISSAFLVVEIPAKRKNHEPNQAGQEWVIDDEKHHEARLSLVFRLTVPDGQIWRRKGENNSTLMWQPLLTQAFGIVCKWISICCLKLLSYMNLFTFSTNDVVFWAGKKLSHPTPRAGEKGEIEVEKD